MIPHLTHAQVTLSCQCPCRKRPKCKKACMHTSGTVMCDAGRQGKIAPPFEGGLVDAKVE
jgi:hypothetical protein